MSKLRITAGYAIVLLLFISIVGALAFSQSRVNDRRRHENVIHQLRIYEIFDGNKKAFHERFRDHAMRIMAKYDFKIVATWESRTDKRTEFVYLLEWPNEATMKDRWAKFLADREWIEIKKATAVDSPLVGEIEDRTLHLTDYSPRRILAK